VALKGICPLKTGGRHNQPEEFSLTTTRKKFPSPPYNIHGKKKKKKIMESSK
jgi:hypothetical protein